jgi:hypothetical protein
VAKAKDAKGLKLVTEEVQDVEARFADLYDRANHKTAAAEKAADRLRALMNENEAEVLWRRIPGPLSVAQSFALEHASGVTPGVRECWCLRLEDIRRDLEGESPSEGESLLAQHAALCWLRLAEVELQYTGHLSKPHSSAQGLYYERRLTLAQRRFTKACETLERVRMMRRRAGPIGAMEAARRRA